jgi:transcriptional regulator with XRE-family HTH domain
MSNFSEFLKAKRAEKDLSFRDLERLSGVSKSYLVQIENGNRGVPKPEKIAMLARGLNMDYNELMRIAGYIDIPPEYQARGLAHVCLTDEYIAKGLTEADIRRTLDAVLAFVEKEKKKSDA